MPLKRLIGHYVPAVRHDCSQAMANVLVLSFHCSAGGCDAVVATASDQLHRRYVQSPLERLLQAALGSDLQHTVGTLGHAECLNGGFDAGENAESIMIDHGEHRIDMHVGAGMGDVEDEDGLQALPPSSTGSSILVAKLSIAPTSVRALLPTATQSLFNTKTSPPSMLPMRELPP